MTRASDDRPLDDRLLVQYLLGTLAEGEAERLDELSIADDAFAWRLRVAEHDLIDAYLNGELSDPLREQVRTWYTASPQRRQKLAFAGALLAFENNHAGAPPATHGAAAGVRADQSRRRIPDVQPRRRLFFQWAPVAAALVASVAAASLFVESQRLKQEVSRSQDARADLQQRTNSLQTELERERAASAGIRDELARRRDSGPSVGAVVRSFVLQPMRRGANEIPAVTLSEHTGEVSFRLGLESDESPAYQATLTDAADAHVVWRSRRLDVQSDGADRYLAVQVPAALFKPRNYTIELTSAPVRGSAAFVTSYAFRVVVK